MTKMQITPEKMKDWRQRNRLSMAQAAHKAGVDKSTWSKWERDIARPTPTNEKQLRAVMDNFEVSLTSTRTREVFFSLLDDELRDYLGATAYTEFHGHSPLSLRTGARRCDKRLEELGLWFTRYFMPPEHHVASLSAAETDLYVETHFAATAAGFCVGNFKYAVTDDDAEDWYQATEALFVDLMAIRKIFERSNPARGYELWRDAFGHFHAGYAAALEEKCCRDSAYYELRLLAGMFADTTNVPKVRSDLALEDFGEPQLRLIFQAVLDLFDEAKPINIDSIQSQLKNISPPGAMDACCWSWPFLAEVPMKGASFLDYLSYIAESIDPNDPNDPNDPMIWALEVKKRSQIRKLMDECRRISNSLEQGFGLTKHLDELEQSILRLRSLDKQDKTGPDNGK